MFQESGCALEGSTPAGLACKPQNVVAAELELDAHKKSIRKASMKAGSDLPPGGFDIDLPGQEIGSADKLGIRFGKQILRLKKPSESEGLFQSSPWRCSMAHLLLP